jgi:hypothetical protein
MLGMGTSTMEVCPAALVEFWGAGGYLIDDYMKDIG